MMMGKEDLSLSLSLSLGFAQTHHPLKLNLNPTSSSISNLQMFPWNQTFVSSSGTLLLQGLDLFFKTQIDLEITHFHFCRSSKPTVLYENRREQLAVDGSFGGGDGIFFPKQHDL